MTFGRHDLGTSFKLNEKTCKFEIQFNVMQIFQFRYFLFPFIVFIFK